MLKGILFSNEIVFLLTEVEQVYHKMFPAHAVGDGGMNRNISTEAALGAGAVIFQ